MNIEFIPWKGISTKSIADWNISATFNVPESFDARKFIDKPLTITIDNGVEIDCAISNEWSSYGYNWTHWTYWIKLDIILPDLLVIWMIFKSKWIDLSVYKDWNTKEV